MAVLYWQRAANYGQTRVFEILQYIAAQSTPRPRPAQVKLMRIGPHYRFVVIFLQVSLEKHLNSAKCACLFFVSYDLKYNGFLHYCISHSGWSFSWFPLIYSMLLYKAYLSHLHHEIEISYFIARPLKFSVTPLYHLQIIPICFILLLESKCRIEFLSFFFFLEQ